MSRYLLSLVLFLNGAMLKAQNVESSSLREFFEQVNTTKLSGGLNVETNIEGSPYNNPDFLPGQLVTTSQEHYDSILLNYNIYTNQVEFMNDKGERLGIEIPELIDHLVIGEEKFIFCPYTVGGKIHKGFLTVLEEGPALLLQKKNIMLKSAEPPQGYKAAEPARFVRTKDDFFLRVFPAEAKKISNSADFLSALSHVPPELDQYLRENKIRFGRKEDLMKLVATYNQILRP